MKINNKNFKLNKDLILAEFDYFLSSKSDNDKFNFNELKEYNDIIVCTIKEENNNEYKIGDKVLIQISDSLYLKDIFKNNNLVKTNYDINKIFIFPYYLIIGTVE